MLRGQSSNACSVLRTEGGGPVVRTSIVNGHRLTELTVCVYDEPAKL